MLCLVSLKAIFWEGFTMTKRTLRGAATGLTAAFAIAFGAIAAPVASAETQIVRSFNSLNECEDYRAKYEQHDSFCAPWKDTSAWALYADVQGGSISGSF